MKKSYSCKILENTEIIKDIYKIKIEYPKDLDKIKPGQFFNIKCGEGDFPLLRRPISVGICENDTLTFYVRKVGEGTELLCKKEKDTDLDILGPLGNGFDLDIDSGNVLIVGGGIGVAPLLELVKELSKKEDLSIKVMLGFRDEPYLIEDFKRFTESVVVASESNSNNSIDHRGYITDLVKDEVKSKEYKNIFTCGPEPMLRIVKEIAQESNIPSRLLMEERMACGIGACLVCNCKVKRGENDWTHVRACKEGPVFNGEEVMFDE